MEQLLALAIALIIMGYGFAYMFGGEKLGARFLRAIGRGIGRGVEGIGRWAARFARRHPRVVGAIILTIIVLASRL
ncbi:MAG: hypothetical protein KBC02_03520 [Candidatus Pacebacteria bacterium]|nr:hypothetical protein [Candidatus Paceibacterota bacterium]